MLDRSSSGARSDEIRTVFLNSHCANHYPTGSSDDQTAPFICKSLPKRCCAFSHAMVSPASPIIIAKKEIGKFSNHVALTRPCCMTAILRPKLK